MISHHVPPSPCPQCSQVQNGATDAGPEGAYPNPGDFTVCINCGAALKFGEQLQLVGITEEEIERLIPDERAQLLRVIGAVAIARKDC